MQLTEHFNSDEFACHCGCGYDDIDMNLVAKLEELRDNVDEPLIINSGCRCPEHNAEVGGVSNSQHVYGKAADVALPDGYTVDEFADLAEEIGFDGIGKYDWGIHVDVRGYTARWDFREDA